MCAASRKPSSGLARDFPSKGLDLLPNLHNLCSFLVADVGSPPNQTPDPNVLFFSYPKEMSELIFSEQFVVFFFFPPLPFSHSFFAMFNYLAACPA